jgi:hypothetical protein
MKTSLDFLNHHINNGEFSLCNKKHTEMVMIEFAKLHVEQALKAAAENVELYEGMHYGTISYEVDEQSILNAYPLDLIK